MSKETKLLPPIVVKRTVQHKFSELEVAKLNVDFRQAYAERVSKESAAKAAANTHKALVTEAICRMDTINALLQAGVEDRLKDCIVVFRPAAKKKDFYVKPEDETVATVEQLVALGEKPVATEDMAPQDFEQDLFRAESAFDDKAELVLWNVEADKGAIIVGKQNGKWFTALRCSIGNKNITERLDAEQPCSKVRFDAIKRAGKRCCEWLAETLDKDVAAGFKAKIEEVVEANKELVE